MSKIERIAQIIAAEQARGFNETLANTLRCAAWFAIEEFPEVTSSEFADAAATLGLHRQASANRFREAVKNLEDA